MRHRADGSGLQGAGHGPAHRRADRTGGALSPVDVTALALRLLEERGFSVSACNTRGDSHYLTPGDEGDGAATLRVSNHARTPKQRRNHPEVAASLILREPKTPMQVEAMVAAAVRDCLAMRAVRARKG